MYSRKFLSFGLYTKCISVQHPLTTLFVNYFCCLGAAGIHVQYVTHIMFVCFVIEVLIRNEYKLNLYIPFRTWFVFPCRKQQRLELCWIWQVILCRAFHGHLIPKFSNVCQSVFVCFFYFFPQSSLVFKMINPTWNVVWQTLVSAQPTITNSWV